MTKIPPFSTALKKQTLAEQVSGTIKEAVLAGQWQPGEALPTEPELAEAFGVSRAVIRDATRMLAAQGLVIAKHGRGVFVTESQAEAFGDALLLALRREGASVWDVEKFEQMVFPEVCALASTEATEGEIVQIEALAKNYIDQYALMSDEKWDSDHPDDKADREAANHAFEAFLTAVFAATHNAMWQLLVHPILRLRSMRNWDVGDVDPPADLFIILENRWVDTVVNAVAGGDSTAARETVTQLMRLPQEAEEAMRITPVGEKPHIRLAHPPSLDD